MSDALAKACYVRCKRPIRRFLQSIVWLRRLDSSPAICPWECFVNFAAKYDAAESDAEAANGDDKEVKGSFPIALIGK